MHSFIDRSYASAKSSRLTHLAIALFVAAGCGDDKGADQTAPLLTSTSPADLATNVELNVAVSATFTPRGKRWKRLRKCPMTMQLPSRICCLSLRQAQTRNSEKTTAPGSSSLKFGTRLA